VTLPRTKENEMLQSIGRQVLAALTLVVLVRPAPVWGWGEEGHRTVARIAAAHLNAKAREGIRDLIGDASISDYRVALWADAIKKSSFYKARYPNNQTWHYIDIDVTADLGSLDLDQVCPQDDCVLKQLPRFVKVLKDPQATFQSRREALFFVVHFVGDAHQPLHCAERNKDHGGNLVRVKLAHDEGGHAPVKNLHQVWDTDLVQEAMGGLTWDDFADRLDAQITPQQQKAWADGTLADWILEAHKLARGRAYAGVPQAAQNGSPFTLPQKYLDDNAEVVKEQLQRAGIRLAKVLNEAFD
jgi:hypothetical protein